MGCGGRQGVYCPGFHQYLLCSWCCVDTETVALALRRACIGSITIKRRRDRTPKLRSRNSDSANRRAATERWRKSSKPLCYPLPQLYAPASSIALSSTGSFAVRIFWPYGGNCSISSNDILNPFTPFGGGSLIRMA